MCCLCDLRLHNPSWGWQEQHRGPEQRPLTAGLFPAPAEELPCARVLQFGKMQQRQRHNIPTYRPIPENKACHVSLIGIKRRTGRLNVAVLGTHRLT